MSTDTPQDLLKEWHAHNLTLERAQGQTLQHLKALYQEIEQAQKRRVEITRAIQANHDNCTTLKTEVEEIQRSLTTIQTDLKRLLDHVDLPPTKLLGKRGRPKKPKKVLDEFKKH